MQHKYGCTTFRSQRLNDRSFYAKMIVPSMAAWMKQKSWCSAIGVSGSDVDTFE